MYHLIEVTEAGAVSLNDTVIELCLRKDMHHIRVGDRMSTLMCTVTAEALAPQAHLSQLVQACRESPGRILRLCYSPSTGCTARPSFIAL